MNFYSLLYRSVKNTILFLFIYNWANLGVVKQDKELMQYVHMFEQEAINHHTKVDNSRLSIYFVEKLPENIIGYCQRYDDPRRKEVVVSLQYWDGANAVDRWTLIAHELGHCDLNLMHRDDPKFYKVDNKPHIMNSILIYTSDYNHKLIDEEFSDAAKLGK